MITNIRNPYLNLDVYATKGVDLEAFYQFDLSDSSQMGLRLFATRTDEVVTVIAGQTHGLRRRDGRDECLRPARVGAKRQHQL